MTNNSENELSLLDKGKNKFFSLIFSRLGLIIILLAFQLALMFCGYLFLRQYTPLLYSFNLLLAAFISVVIINSGTIDPTSKITWLAVISIFPVFGALFFIYNKYNTIFRWAKKKNTDIVAKTQNLLPQDKSVYDKLKEENPADILLTDYLCKSNRHPVYANTSVEYFPLGEDKFRRMITELEKAEKFIFLEYFIIDEGRMWGRILDILSKKYSRAWKSLLCMTAETNSAHCLKAMTKS